MRNQSDSPQQQSEQNPGLRAESPSNRLGALVATLNGLVHSRIRRMSLILVSVPIVFMLLFAVFLIRLSRSSEQAQDSYLRSRAAITETSAISADLADAESSVRGYVATGDPKFARVFDGIRQELPKRLASLQNSSKDNPAQEVRALSLRAKALEKIAWLEGTYSLMHSGSQAQAVERIRTGNGLRIMEDFRRIREEFLQEQHRLDGIRAAAARTSWQQFHRLFVMAGVVFLFFTVTLALMFGGGISKQIGALTENAKALAKGRKAINPPLKGADEIAQLDRVFRKMAAALQDAARRERGVFENALDVICSTDAEGKFLTVSPSSLKVWGYLPEELIGRNYTEFLVPDDISRSEQNAAEIAHGKPVTDFENRYVRKDGSTVNMLWSAWWSEVDQTIHAMARDITGRKEAEAAISELNNDLEKRAAQLEAANRELEAFSYSVSHDLRAPLRAIDGFSRILQDEYSGKLDENGNRLLEVVRKNAQNMGQLIDDLLAFSRLGRKEIQPAQIDMADLAKSVFAELHSADPACRSRLEIESIPPALGDPALLRQVFVNLLSNAAKYSRIKQQPIIEIGGGSKNGRNLYFVKDNGAGFDMQYADKLFGVFQRLHHPEEFEGTGVGLAIVQRIIHRHVGKVWAEGKVNDGATFYFTLPKEGNSHGQLSRNG